MSVEFEENSPDSPAALNEDGNERSGRLPTVVRDVRLLLIALWLGGAVFFSATVAPSAFAVLRARDVVYANEAAGSIVSRTLTALNKGGFVIGLSLLASAFLFVRGASRRSVVAETVALAILAIATGVGEWIIAAKLMALRTAMARPIDDVPVGDPMRMSFESLHAYSVTALCVAISAAAVALLLIARRGQNRYD